MSVSLKPLVPQFVVGITGKAGHGKDTVARAILESLPRGEYGNVYRLADPLKRAYETLFSLDRGSMENFQTKNERNSFTGTTHRQELQFLGTEAYRTRTGNPDVWIQLLAHNVLREETEEGLVVVPDVRFPNEAEFIQQNGILVEVRRENSELVTHSAHVSEAGIGNIKPDYVIDNSGTLDELFTKVDVFVETILTPERNRLRAALLAAKRTHILMSRLQAETEKLELGLDDYISKNS